MAQFADMLSDDELAKLAAVFNDAAPASVVSKSARKYGSAVARQAGPLRPATQDLGAHSAVDDAIVADDEKETNPMNYINLLTDLVENPQLVHNRAVRGGAVCGDGCQHDVGVKTVRRQSKPSAATRKRSFDRLQNFMLITLTEDDDG